MHFSESQAWPSVRGSARCSRVPEGSAVSLFGRVEEAPTLRAKIRRPPNFEALPLPLVRRAPKRNGSRSLDGVAGAIFLGERPRLARDRVVDFLFGGQAPSVIDRAVPSARITESSLLETLTLGLSSQYCPKMFRATEDDSDDEPEKGLFKAVPRGLACFATLDALAALTLALSRSMVCDSALRRWLLGGIVLGFPTSLLVHTAANIRPTFRYYRLVATRLRGGRPVSEMELGGLRLVGRFRSRVPRYEESQAGAIFSVTFEAPTLVTGYEVVTSRSAAAALDPVSWLIEGSRDGFAWEELDNCEDMIVPTIRGASTQLLQDMLHLEESTNFRGAFLLEMVASAASFVWLMLGTSSVAGSTDTCLDSAPPLWIGCFLSVVTTWSWLGTIVIGIIITAVAIVALGAQNRGSS